MTNVFREIRSDLLNKRKVLFSGTPCQVCGLNSYIGTQLGENLTTIDLVCHGVPSPSVWREYIKFIEKKMVQFGLVPLEIKVLGGPLTMNLFFYRTDIK